MENLQKLFIVNPQKNKSFIKSIHSYFKSNMFFYQSIYIFDKIQLSNLTIKISSSINLVSINSSNYSPPSVPPSISQIIHPSINPCIHLFTSLHSSNSSIYPSIHLSISSSTHYLNPSIHQIHISKYPSINCKPINFSEAENQCDLP